MSLNSTTCSLVNGTSVCSFEHSSTIGLAVGLSLSLLLLVIIAALAVYTQRTRCGNMFESVSSSVKKEDNDEDNSQRYTMTREQSSGQAPIYENLQVQTSDRGRTAIHMYMSPSDPEEDLYLQCDSPDDAIYSNDLACRLSMLPPVGQEEEDLYIVPDAV